MNYSLRENIPTAFAAAAGATNQEPGPKWRIIRGAGAGPRRAPAYFNHCVDHGVKVIKGCSYLNVILL